MHVALSVGLLGLQCSEVQSGMAKELGHSLSPPQHMWGYIRGCSQAAWPPQTALHCSHAHHDCS